MDEEVEEEEVKLVDMEVGLEDDVDDRPVSEKIGGHRMKTSSFPVCRSSFWFLGLGSKMEDGGEHLLDMVVVEVGVHGAEYVARSGGGALGGENQRGGRGRGERVAARGSGRKREG